jgi:hypothetical protein
MKLQHWEPAAESLCRLTRVLHAESVEYVAIGERALRAHGCRRVTDSLEICVEHLKLDGLNSRLRSAGFVSIGEDRLQLADRSTHVHCSLHKSGFPVHFSGRSSEIHYPFPTDAFFFDCLPVVCLARALELALATRRYRDWAYVVDAIRARGLDEGFARELHATVRAAYLQCLEQKVEEDRYDPQIHDAPPKED